MRVTFRSGFPIRKSTDQSPLAAPHGLSQRVTSFIASQRQGIHQMPLETLDQTVRKGKCRRINPTEPPKRRSHKQNCRIAHISQGRPLKKMRPCNPTVLDVFTNFVKQRDCPGEPVQPNKTGAFSRSIMRHPAMPTRAAVWQMVGTGRFELPTSRLSVVRSNQLSYAPVVSCRSGKRPIWHRIERKRFARWRWMRCPPSVFP